MTMNRNILENIIRECVYKILNEGYYDNSVTPIMNGGRREIGINPLRTDVGNHSPNEEVRQPSTYDKFGANFKGEHIIVSDNKFMFYKVKNFGNPDISGTISFFDGTKGLRTAIDTLNGGAARNGRNVLYRTITGMSAKTKSEKSGYMLNTFWEFSVDGGKTWFILKPKPLENVKKSQFNVK